MPKLIAVWNTQLKLWIKPEESLFSEHSEPFLETWPTSGMMRNGQVFELLTQEHPTSVSESSLLRSPKASEGQGGALGEAVARERGNTVGVRDQVMDLVASQGMRVSRKEANDLLPTPKARDYSAEGYEAGLRRSTPQVGTIVKGIAEKDERVIGAQVNDLLPTPIVRDYKDGQAEVLRYGKVQTDTVGRAIMNSGEVLLGTPRTSSANGATPKQVESGAPKARIEDQVLITSWGKFQPAIERWEKVFGRPAPAPTKPDGRNESHRLSSKFTEWMMGLPEGWVTNAGLSRTEELKACGNGVVPAQAELALSILLRDTGFIKGEQNENM